MRTYQCSLFVALAVFCASAEKVLLYDEEKGIIFADKDHANAVSKKNSAARPPSDAPVIERERARPASSGKTVDAGILRGRQKDPPEVYFESGLQYFKNGNYDDALKNFTHADSLDPQPKYVLWMGKTLRQLQKRNQLLFVMNRLLTTYPESDVADDALFEIAFCYQTDDDYAMAAKAYTQLAEQYPFGTSYSNGESFRSVAHKQCQMMRAEVISTLRVLGYSGDDVETLYSAFQKDKGLPVTGTGDRKTIKAMKSAYDDFLKLQATQTLKQDRINKYRIAALAMCGVVFINCIIVFIINRKIAARRKNLSALSLMLSDLTTGTR